MANTLITGNNYSDTKSVAYSSPYSAIDEVINCKRKKQATIIRKIYSDADNKLPKNAVESIMIICKNWEELVDEETVVHNDYDEYLSVAAVTEDDNEFSRAYAYWEEKAPEQVGNYKKSDWESDES